MDVLTIQHLDEPGVFALEGELDMSCCDELIADLRVAPADGDLILDLSGLSFMDSSGLRVILQAAAMRNNGSRVVLRDPTRAVAHVLEIALPGEVPGVVIEWSFGEVGNGRGNHVTR